MRASKKYGRNVPKDRTYRAHKRNALTHFQKRWRNRLTHRYKIDMPPIDTLREELRKAMYDPGGSRFFDKVSERQNSTRFMCRIDGEELIISYDHNLKVPVTVWMNKEYDEHGQESKELS